MHMINKKNLFLFLLLFPLLLKPMGYSSLSSADEHPGRSRAKQRRWQKSDRGRRRIKGRRKDTASEAAARSRAPSSLGSASSGPTTPTGREAFRLLRAMVKGKETPDFPDHVLSGEEGKAVADRLRRVQARLAALPLAQPKASQGQRSEQRRVPEEAPQSRTAKPYPRAPLYFPGTIIDFLDER